MAIIYHLSYCDEFEADGFFNEHGILIHAFSNNDAMWRSEYMNPLLEHLGHEIKSVESHDRPDLVQQLLSYFGQMWGEEFGPPG